MERWQRQAAELQTRLDAITIDFGKTVANLKMAEEVRRAPLLSFILLSLCAQEVSNVKMVAESSAKKQRAEVGLSVASSYVATSVSQPLQSVPLYNANPF